MAFFISPNVLTEASRQGATPRTFTFIRNGGSEASAATYLVGLQFTGSAQSGTDAGGSFAPFTMTAGQTTATFTVDIVEDTVIEPTETFNVTVSDQASPNTPVVTTTVSIFDDDTPILSVGDVLLAEGSIPGGTTPYTFTITRSGGTAAAASVDYTVVTGTTDNGFALATGPAITDDFAGALPSGTVTFAPGETVRTVTVPVVADANVEGDESFSIRLSNPGSAIITRAVGTAVIFNDESAGGVSVRSSAFEERPDGTSVATIVLGRSDSNTPFTVDYVTSDGSAIAGSDYVAASGRVSFAPYQRSANVEITIIGDSTREAFENFQITFSNPTNGLAITSAPVSVGIIDSSQFGGAGNDTLTGNTASDTLIGRAGDDTYVVNNSGVAIVEEAGNGNDTVLTSVSYVLRSDALAGDPQVAVEALATQNAAGTDAINLTGNRRSQSITGNAGDNIINGFGGNDTMTGLGGNDQYLVRGPGDVVIEGNGGGNDTVFTTVSYNLGVNEVEVLSTVTNSDTTPIDLIGNFATQTVIGNYGNNVLNGGSGGRDVLIGLRGNDIYAVGDSATVIVEAAGEGDDTLVTAVDYTLAAGVSVEVLSAQNRAFTTPLVLRGNEFAQIIAGNGGNNSIDGGGGNDQLIGGGGADSFRFTTALGAGNVDSLVDFDTNDRIALASGIFGGITVVTAANFVVGASATTADQRIVYNQGAGQLLFDADGSGSGAAVLFALLAPNTPLAVANFEIV